MGIEKVGRACMLFLCVMFLLSGSAIATNQQSITGTISNVQGFTIFLQGYEQGFYLAATSSLNGISLSNLDSLVGKSVTITYQSVNGKNGIVTLVVNN